MGILQEDDVGDIGAVPVCQSCGSERVARGAFACWNSESGLWELEQVLAREYCHQCKGRTRLAWKRLDGAPRGAVRDLNDRFRRQGLGNGSLLVTSGLRDRGATFVERAVDAVRRFDTFTKDNDPWGEHDYGAVEIDGEPVFWKIDAYDPTLSAASENPANEALTHRVLTIMLASEY